MKTNTIPLSSLLFAAGGTLFAVSSASAQSWSGATNGDWLTGTNWTGGVAAGSTTPGDTDVAVFNVNANNTVAINMTTTSGVYHLGAIDNTGNNTRIIQNTSGTTGVLTLNGATVNSVANTIIRNSTASLLTIGNSASGTLGLALGNATANVIQITGNGGITINNIISGSNGISRQGTGAGTLTLSGNNSYTGVTAITAGAIAISNSNALGATGSGNNTTIAATGATNGPRLLISGNINSPENITLTGTTETINYAAAINNTANTNTLSGNITLAGSSGLKIGASGGTLNLTGTISQTGTSHQLVLQPFAATAVISVSNPIANNGGELLVVGSNGTAGALAILNGVSGSGIGMTTIGQRGTLRLGISDALNTSRNLVVGYGGTAAGEDMAAFDLRGFNQTINALNGTAGSSNPSANSNRVVTNGAASGTSILTLGNGGGSGSFNGQINNGATANIQLIKTGAGNQTLNDQNSYTGGTRIDEGTLTLGHATNTLADTGAVNVNGGTLALGTRTDTVGAVTLTSGSITGSGAGKLTGTGSSFDVRSGTVSAKLGGAVGLTKTTVGTVTLSGDNDYSGATNVSGGTLAVNGSHTGGGTTTVANARLQGSGLITGPVTIGSGATLAAGNSIESLGGGALTLDNGSVFEQEIKNADADGADLFFSSGTLSLSGTVTLNLIDIADTYAWVPGDKVTLISYSGTPSLGSTFSYAGAPGGDLDEGEVFTHDGAQWVFKYQDTTPGENYKSDALLAGTNFVTMTVVPEAGSAALLGLGLFVIFLRRRAARA